MYFKLNNTTKFIPNFCGLLPHFISRLTVQSSSSSGLTLRIILMTLAIEQTVQGGKHSQQEMQHLVVLLVI
jgi:hypothetical protein